MRFAGPGWRTAVLAILLAACGGGGTDARVATGVTATTPTSQTGVAGTPVAQAPAVRVTDQDGRPMADVAVYFTVTGGGTLGTHSTRTNASGVASSGSWMLGLRPGIQSVSARVPSLSSVLFSATAMDPCDLSVPYTLAGTLAAELAAGDCRLGSGKLIDYYAVRLPVAQGVTVRVNAAFDTWLEMYAANGDFVAGNDDAAPGDPNAVINVFAPAGDYFLGATSFDPGQTGAYQLSSTALAENANCREHWVVPGVVIAGVLEATDCNAGGRLADGYLLALRNRQTLTVRMETAALDAYLDLYDSSGSLVRSDDDGAGGTDALLTYTATRNDVFLLAATGKTAGLTGAYTLGVSRAAAGQAAQQAEPPHPAGASRAWPHPIPALRPGRPAPRD